MNIDKIPSDFDINKPLENPTLSAMLNELKNIDHNNTDVINQCMNKIAREVANNAKFLSVIKIDDNNLRENSPNKFTIQENTIMSFNLYKGEDGKIFFPIFTDWQELRKGDDFKNKFIKTCILSFDDYYTMVKDNGYNIVINPFSDNVVFYNEEILHMKEIKDKELSNHTQYTVEKETEVLLGEPKNYPTEMIEAIKNYVCNIKEIKAIWFKLMTKDKETSFLFIVDFKGDRQNIFNNIAQIAIPYLPKGMYIDMIPLDSGFGKEAATGDPFYKRKKRFFGFEF